MQILLQKSLAGLRPKVDSHERAILLPCKERTFLNQNKISGNRRRWDVRMIFGRNGRTLLTKNYCFINGCKYNCSVVGFMCIPS